MDKKKINLIFSISLLVLGIVNIFLGLFSEKIPHDLQLASSILQILVGLTVLYTVILKIKGKF